MIIISVGGINGKSEDGDFIEKEKKKMGRPTDNPKSESLHIRLDAETSRILDEYCEDNDVSRTEAVRHGIRKLKEDK